MDIGDSTRLGPRNPAGPIAGAGWVGGATRIGTLALIVGVTWFAAAMKVVDWPRWVEYVGQFGGVGASAKVVVPALEAVLPLALLGRRRSVQNLGAWGLSTMYLGFAWFHYSRLAAGVAQPCACFGSLLSLDSAVMLVLCLVLAVAGGLSAPGVPSTLSRWYASGNRNEKAFFLLSCSLLVATLAYRYGVTVDPERPVFRLAPARTEDLLESTRQGVVQIAGGSPLGSTVVAAVDPDCPHSRRLLESLRSHDAEPLARIRLVFYPVTSPASSAETALRQIRRGLAQEGAEVLEFASGAEDTRQFAFLDRLAQGRAPRLWATVDGWVVEVSTQGDVRDHLERLSKLELGRSKP